MSARVAGDAFQAGEVLRFQDWNTGMAANRVRIGARRSRLALAQARLVADLIARAFPGTPVELVGLSSRGDEQPDAPIMPESGRGMFTGFIQDALLRGEIELAVHSLKDLPVEEPAGLVVAATPLREDPLDALVSRDGLTLDRLAPGAKVGTSSPRRAAQVRLARPDLEVEPIRGNVETRLRKVDGGEFEAAVLAAAGLIRLGLEARISQRLGPPQFLPAPGQGALAVEARAGDRAVLELAAAIDDPMVRACADAERAFLAALGGGCLKAAGALARMQSSELVLQAGLYGEDAAIVVVHGDPSEAVHLGTSAARRLLKGAAIGQ